MLNEDNYFEIINNLYQDEALAEKTMSNNIFQII